LDNHIFVEKNCLIDYHQKLTLFILTFVGAKNERRFEGILLYYNKCEDAHFICMSCLPDYKKNPDSKHVMNEYSTNTKNKLK